MIILFNKKKKNAVYQKMFVNHLMLDGINKMIYLVMIYLVIINFFFNIHNFEILYI
jgi:hypothetical protein